MTKKTADELQAELDLVNLAKEVRRTSDELYAIKLVEKIVFAMVGLILIGVITAMIALVIK